MGLPDCETDAGSPGNPDCSRFERRSSAFPEHELFAGQGVDAIEAACGVHQAIVGDDRWRCRRFVDRKTSRAVACDRIVKTLEKVR